MKEDQFIEKYLNAIKQAETNDEKKVILNKLYEAGFADGVEHGEN